jgi:hypothetical protein
MIDGKGLQKQPHDTKEESVGSTPGADAAPNHLNAIEDFSPTQWCNEIDFNAGIPWPDGMKSQRSTSQLAV